MSKHLYNIIKKKDCFGNNKYEYCFEKKIDSSFVKFLRTFGEVKIFKEFTIPLIKMDVSDFRLNTLTNSHSIDVSFKDSNKNKRKFENKLNEFLK